MPTYEYACTACGHRLEAVQRFTDPALTECPVCHGALRKVFSPVGVLFKGSGFYKTDSRAAAARADKADKDGKAEAGKPAAEGKPAAGGKPSGTEQTAAAGKPSSEGSSGGGKSGPGGPTGGKSGSSKVA